MRQSHHPEGILATLALSAMLASSQSVTEKLSSSDWVQRAAAAHAFSEFAGRPAKDDHALISLLASEDAIVRAAFVEGPGAAQKYGEEYAEYVGTLTDIVMRIAANHPEYPDVWSALVNAPYDPESQFVISLARHAEKVAPLLLAQATSADPSPGNNFQGHSIEVLGRISGFDKAQIRPKLTTVQISEIDDLVRSALASRKEAVRIGAIRGLSAMGSQGDVAVLERLSHDPSLGSIAANALKDLQKRLNGLPQR